MTTLETIELRATLDDLWKVEHAVQKLADDGTISQDAFGNVIVAVTEATLNAILHGAGNNMNQNVEVKIAMAGNVLEIVVSDFGKGFNVNALPDPTDPANIESVNGRGVFIMKSLADKLEYENNGATVRMSFNLGSKLSVGAND